MRKQNFLAVKLGLLVMLILVAGTLGYTLIEDGWSLFDGFYMTLITLTTIGYGEVHKLSPAGRIFTTFIIVVGLGAAAAILGQFARIMLEDNLSENWRKRRMAKQISRMKNHVIICGFGRIGKAISGELMGMGISCVIIDRDEDRGRRSQSGNIPTVIGNATHDEILIEAGIKRASILVAALSNDSDNLFVALAARDLNRDLMVIARGEDKSIETRMLRAGVDRVVYPSQLGGGQIARLVGSELGHDVDQVRSRRATDVMGYDLQIYRNFKKTGMTVDEILSIAGALEVVAHIDSAGKRCNHPGPEHLVGHGEGVVLLVETVSSPEMQGSDELKDIGLGDISVQIPALDEEHMTILALVRKVRGLDVNGTPIRVTREILGELEEYMAKHFHHEEQLLLASDYPEVEHHIRLHRMLSEQVSQLVKDGEKLSPLSLAEILESWVLNHIMVEDRAYAEHLGGVQV